MTVDVVRDMSRVMDALGPEQNQQLDYWAGQYQKLLNTVTSAGGPAGRQIKNWLNGVWLGHPLHPALTDAAIGAWSTGFILDVVGATREADAAMTVGVLAAVPTALSGSADFADISEEPRRIALIHAVLNATGLVLMVGSLAARRGDKRGLGIGLSTLGLGLTGVSAWLGGELVYRLGTQVSRIAFEPHVEEFQVVCPEAELPEGKLVAKTVSVEGGEFSIALLKKGHNVQAVSNACPHWGGPLAEGKLLEDDTVVECPWHGSQFNLVDGRVCQGPAAEPTNVFETRIREGKVEVRRR
ncbi:MAG: Rieske 2Fe-2S domain-containing protein [Chloroflexi bacterium]|nr:Rieske 2Fe-2S domain-containing protein [Chloroflexota bacterium]MBV9598536.1 Rieske 2Fe-2S domain-containing protein [Chloroflexota bacterium]